jgi:hypothetical protein
MFNLYKVFAISDRVRAKICERSEVPIPPRAEVLAGVQGIRQIVGRNPSVIVRFKIVRTLACGAMGDLTPIGH